MNMYMYAVMAQSYIITAPPVATKHNLKAILDACPLSLLN